MNISKSDDIVRLNPEQAATIVLSSGSSGDPKYVIHSLENHFYNAEGVNEYFKINNDSIYNYVANTSKNCYKIITEKDSVPFYDFEKIESLWFNIRRFNSGDRGKQGLLIEDIGAKVFNVARRPFNFCENTAGRIGHLSFEIVLIGQYK